MSADRHAERPAATKQGLARVARPDDVHIAGIGLVTPLGHDVPTTWGGLCEGRSGIRRIRQFDARGFQAQIAGEVDAPAEPYPSRFFGHAVTERKTRFAAQALDEAMATAGLSRGDLERAPTGLFSGSEKEVSDDLSVFTAYDREADHPDVVAQRHHQEIAGRYADAFNRLVAARLPNLAVSFNYAMACAASAVAALQAVRWLRRGLIDRAIVLGVDTPVKSSSVLDFQLLGALSTQNLDPTKASRPFDANRDGFVLAEGAGAMILESARIATRDRRGRFGSIAGIGITNNRFHMTNTPRAGVPAARAMRLALADAGLRPSDIGYINAHGTSTDVGDIGETNAISEVFDPPPPISSTKSMTGHLVAAAGIVELIVTCLALRHQFLPPTINQEHPDLECPLDYVANQGRTTSVRFAMTNSFGFGGTNVALVVER